MSDIRVYIFDDNPRLRDSLKMLFNEEEDFNLIGFSPDCSHAVEDVRNARPDVIIMDIDMPNVNGIEGVKLIKKEFPTVQILMQTVFDDDEKVFAAIRAGAAGYILKNVNPSGLLESVREVYNGGSPMTPGIARKVLQHFQEKKSDIEQEDFNLTAREKEVLGLLVQGNSYKMIGDQLHISYETVRSHMKKIYEKLHVASMTEAVAKAINRKLFGIFW